MSKFQKGDIVRYFGNDEQLKNLNALIVLGTYNSICKLKDMNSGDIWYAPEIRLDLLKEDELAENKLHNIVQVRYKEDYNADWYCFNVPAGIELKKGDVVRVRNQKGKKETVAICVTDSEVVNENVLNMIMKGNNVISNVIGIYKLEMFGEQERNDTNEEIN